MSEDQQVQEQKWRALWEKLKAQNPTVEQCGQLRFMSNMSFAITLDVYDYVASVHTGAATNDLIDWFVYVLKTCPADFDPAHEQTAKWERRWTYILDSIMLVQLDSEDGTTSVRASYLASMIRYSLMRWSVWTVYSAKGYPHVLLVQHIGQIRSMDVELSERILHAMMERQHTTNSYHLGCCKAILEHSGDPKLRDEAAEAIVWKMGNWEPFQLAKALFKLYVNSEKWKKDIWRKMVTTTIPQLRSYFMVDVVMNVPGDRKQAWECLKANGHLNEGTLAKLFAWAKTNHVEEIANEAWALGVQEFSFHDLQILAEQFSDCVQMITEEVVRRVAGADSQKLANALSHMKEVLRRAVLVRLHAKGLMAVHEHKLREYFPRDFAACFPVHKGDVEDLIEQMKQLDAS